MRSFSPLARLMTRMDAILARCCRWYARRYRVGCGDHELEPVGAIQWECSAFYPEGVVARLPTQSANEIPHQVGTNLTPKACSPEASSEIRELASFQWAECLATQALSARRL